MYGVWAGVCSMIVSIFGFVVGFKPSQTLMMLTVGSAFGAFHYNLFITQRAWNWQLETIEGNMWTDKQPWPFAVSVELLCVGQQICIAGIGFLGIDAYIKMSKSDRKLSSKTSSLY